MTMYFIIEPPYAYTSVLWCFLLANFLLSHAQTVNKTIEMSNVTNSSNLMDHIQTELRCLIWTCAYGNTKDISVEVNHSADFVYQLCTHGELTSFNSTHRCGITFSSTAKENAMNVSLCHVHWNERDLFFMHEKNSIKKDKNLLYAFHFKGSKSKENVYIHSIRLKDHKDLNLLCCIKYQQINYSSNINDINIFYTTIFNDICRKKFINDVEVTLKFCSQNSTLNELCSIYRNLRSLILLLKRKCRCIHVTSKKRLFKMHRTKRDLRTGKEISSATVLKDSTSKEIRPKREGHKMEGALPETTIKYEKVGDVWIPKFNETAYLKFLAKEQLKQDIRMESEWAYLCLVFLSMLMIFSLWCLRGFHSRNKNKRLVTHSDRDHYLTVKEVLYQKARYLPMFNHEGPLEEVFVHDCGTNTDSSRLDMIS